MDPGDVREVGVRRAVRLGHGRPRAGRPGPARQPPPRGLAADRPEAPRRDPARSRRDDRRRDPARARPAQPERRGTSGRPTTSRTARSAGGSRRATRSGASGTSRSARSACCPDDLDRQGHDRARLRDRRTSRRGWPGAGRDRSAIDNSEQQLATARRLQAEHGIDVPARPRQRRVGARIPTRASISRSPSTARRSGPIRGRWIPEAARLLRPGGRLIFLINATLLMLCMPDEERPATNEMLRPLRGLHRLEWSSDDVGQLRPRPRRLDPGPASERVRDREPRRAVAGRGRDDDASRT